MSAAPSRSRLPFLLTSTALVGLFASAAGAADFTVATGTTVTSTQTLNTAGNTGTVNGTVAVSSGSQAVALTAASGTVTVNNNGVISQAGSGRAIRYNVSGGTAKVVINNALGALIWSTADDVMKVSTAATYAIDNQGTIWAKGSGTGSGQALDLRDVATSGNSIVNGSATNTAAIIRADGDDALRPGANTTITNWGTIASYGPVNTKCPDYLGTTACASSKSAHDGIDVGGNTGVSIENYGTILGPRHAITADTDVTVHNYASGTITGRNGSGVGSDGNGTVYNWGTIEGTYAGAGNVYEQTSTPGTTSSNGDGDGVDIDYLATIENHGTIKGTGAGGVDSTGRANLSEGLSIGGGTVHNYVGATISGYGRGITVTGNDTLNADLSQGPTLLAPYAVTITNEGTIQGLALAADGTTPGTGGAAIRIYSDLNNAVTNSGTISGAGSEAAIWIIGSGANTVTNSGTITATGTGKAILFGSGNDQLNIRSGSVITGVVDGGDGTDTVDLSGTGTAAAPDVFAGAVNFEAMTVSAGVWSLSGTSQAYANGISVASGATLEAAGTVGSAVTVLTGGTLSGTGHVGSLTLSGTLAPGAVAGATGTLTIDGNATIAAGSTVAIDADAAGAADRLAVGGTLTLQGGTVQVTAGSGNYAPATAYTIATATSVVGTFAQVSSNLAFLTPTLSYSASDVTLTLTRNATLIQSFGNGDNQRAAGAALDGLPTASPLYLSFVNLSASGARAALSNLTTGSATGSSAPSMTTGSAFSGMMGQMGSGGGDGGLSVSVGSTGGALGYADDGRASKKPRIEIATPAERVWRLWGQGFGAAADRFADASAGAAASSSRGGGMAIGLDHRFGGIVVGLALGTSRTLWSVSGSDAAGSVDGVHVGPYASVDLGAFRLGGSLAWSGLTAREHRTITVGGTSERVVSDHRDDEWRMRLEIDRTFALFPETRVTPFAAIEPAVLRRGGSTERLEAGGTSTLGLATLSSATRSMPLFVGLRGEHRFVLPEGRSVTPSLGLAWVHEFSPDRSGTAAFVAAPSSAFAIEGARVASDSLRIDAGVKTRISDAVGFDVQLASELSDRSRSLTGRAMLRVAW